MRFETYAPLAALNQIRHSFSLRSTTDTKIDEIEPQVIQAAGFVGDQYASAEQPHGNGVARVDRQASRYPGVDALITRQPALTLLIRCADCAAVYIVDPVTPAIGLAHSGKKGTIANIVGATIAGMQRDFDTHPGNCRAVISPCIGPCHYEYDLCSTIESQLSAAGVTDIHNPRICTACHLDRYYSYRAERGQTGRMFALLALQSPCTNG